MAAAASLSSVVDMFIVEESARGTAGGVAGVVDSMEL